jgi:hypothetical protein
MQEHSSTSSRRIASRHVAKAIILCCRAGEQLQAASQTTPDKYSCDRLRFLATGLRELALPLSRIASCFEKGEGACD